MKKPILTSHKSHLTTHRNSRSFLYFRFQVPSSKLRDDGQSLVEVLISLGLFSGLSLAIISLYIFSAQAVKVSQARLDARGQIRAELNSAASDVRTRLNTIVDGVYKLDAIGKLGDPLSGTVTAPCVVVSKIARAGSDGTASMNVPNPGVACRAPVAVTGIEDRSGKTVTVFSKAGDSTVELTKVVLGWEGLVFEQSDWRGDDNKELWLGKTDYEEGENVTTDSRGDLKLTGGTSVTYAGTSSKCPIAESTELVSPGDDAIVNNLSVAVNSEGEVFANWLVQDSTQYEARAVKFRDFDVCASIENLPFEGSYQSRNAHDSSIKRINYRDIRDQTGPYDRGHSKNFKADVTSGSEDSFLSAWIAELSNSGSVGQKCDKPAESVGFLGTHPIKLAGLGGNNPNAVCAWAVWFDKDGFKLPKIAHPYEYTPPPPPTCSPPPCVTPTPPIGYTLSPPAFRPDLLLPSDTNTQHGITPVVTHGGVGVVGVRREEELAVISFDKSGNFPMTIDENGDPIPTLFTQLSDFDANLIEPPRIVALPYDNKFAVAFIKDRTKRVCTRNKITDIEVCDDRVPIKTITVPVYNVDSMSGDITVDKCYIEEIEASQVTALNGTFLAATGTGSHDWKLVLARSNEVTGAINSRVYVREIRHDSRYFQVGVSTSLDCDQSEGYGATYPRSPGFVVAEDSDSDNVVSGVKIEFLDNFNYVVAFGRYKSTTNVYETRFVTNSFGGEVTTSCIGFSSPECKLVDTVDGGTQMMDLAVHRGSGGSYKLIFLYSKEDGTLPNGLPEDVMSKRETVVVTPAAQKIISSAFDLGRYNARIESMRLKGNFERVGSATVTLRVCATDDSNDAKDHVGGDCIRKTVDPDPGDNISLTNSAEDTLPLIGRYVWYELKIESSDPDATLKIDSVSIPYGF